MSTAARKFPFNPVVTFTAAGVILLFLLLGLFMPSRTEDAFEWLQSTIGQKLGWFYIVSVGFFLVFVIWLWFSSYSSIRLGRDDDEPEFTNLTWFSMLFSAGMGIGLLFWSVAEPIAHFSNPPSGEGGTVQAAREAITYTFFHWGLHAWAIYIVLGLSLAYFSFRHDLPLTIRSALYPLLGKRINGPLGYAVEVLAIFGTLFGVATSLGLGATQIGGGLEYLGYFTNSTTTQIVIICIITAVATVSVVSGLEVGIRRLSEMNLGLGFILMLFILIAGPTVYIFGTFVQGVGQYVSNLVALTFRTEAITAIIPGQEEDATWAQTWTMFYWAWWISWSPFVGMFIARISRGRTIREFITGVMFVPVTFTFIWLVIFGGTAIQMELTSGGTAGIITAISPEGNFSFPELGLFAMLNNLSLSNVPIIGTLPWAVMMKMLAIVVIATYFVTSSDSASLVIDILSTDGHPNPPVAGRVFWAITEGAIAAVLLLTGGLMALQAAAITTALPLTLIMLLICWSLVRGLRAERRLSTGASDDDIPREMLDARRFDPIPMDDADTAEDADQSTIPEDWRPYLQNMFSRKAEGGAVTPELEKTHERMSTFIEQTVLPAFKTLRKELEQNNREVQIHRLRYHVALRVLRDGNEEFFYAIRCRAYRRRVLTFPEMSKGNPKPIARGEVVLRGGLGSNRPLNEWTRDTIIRDFLDEYSKWMGW